ncbi:MAG TPA: hypothetical protein VGL20_08450 [Candidatus Dormibacteraeota bacterium]|jgi:hypothetical protein
MQSRRHAILYDVDRWRRFRLPLLLFATGCLLATLLQPVFQHGKTQAGLAPLSFLGAAFYGFAFNFWLRQRFSTLSVEGDNLVIRRTGMSQRIPLAEVRRARVARVSATANKPERRRVLPRPVARWLETEALTLRLDTPAEQLVKLRRLLGRQFLFESDLVVPVVDVEGLLREIEEAMPRPDAAPPAARRRRRR